MAKAHGDRDYKGTGKEIGWYKVSLTKAAATDRLTAGLSEEQIVFQWHGDTFDPPRGSQILASNKDYPCQLVRMGRYSYAMQFHLEVTTDMVRQWLNVKENVEEIKGCNDSGGAIGGEIEPRFINSETVLHIGALGQVGGVFFKRFLSLPRN